MPQRALEQNELRVIEKKLIVDNRFPPPARRLENLVQQLLKVNRQEAIRAIHDGGVRINGRFVRMPATMLAVGDRLEVEYEPPAPKVASPAPDRKEPMQVVFEDEHLAVVNKPAALLTVPTPYKEKVTLISLLEKHLRRHGSADQKAYCVHRLDRGVSGLLVFGKRLDVAEALRDQFAERKPQRLYLALVAGTLAEREGTFRTRLATDEALNRYSTDDESGELAITHYRLVKQLQGASLAEVRLETGRRNQIRVHFAETGHPVLGDPRYGSGVKMPVQWTYRRLALHAVSLGFTHPVLGTPLSFESPLPREMQAFIQQTGRPTHRPPRK
jgi:23S rRNA pseudouridine1911/1915/1917 synthase